MMNQKTAVSVMLVGCAAMLWASGVVPAIIPAAVPTANKIGNSTKFQLGASGAVSGDCATFDASLNLTGPGTGAGCGGAGTAGGGLTVYSGTAGIALSGTVFFPVGGGSAANATETSVDADIQADTTISRFGVNISTALGLGNSVVFTWRKNAADQTLTCTISGGSDTSCGDSTHSFTVTPGDLLAVKAVFSGTIVVTPTFVLTAQVGTMLSGNVASGTQFQVGEYLTAGSTVSGVSIPNCPDSGGNHVNFASGTGVFTCGSSGTGGAPGGSNGQFQYNNSGAFGGVGSPTQPNLSTTGAPIASLPTSGWTLIGGAVLNDFSIGVTHLHVLNGSLNWRLATRAITVPYTLYALIDIVGFANCNSQDGGVYLSNGTRLEGIEILSQQAAGAPTIRVETMNSVTSDNTTVAGPTASVVGQFTAVKITNNSTNRVFSYWSNGAWVQLLSEASGTWLTETTAGFGGLTACSASLPVDVKLYYWSVQ